MMPMCLFKGPVSVPVISSTVGVNQTQGETLFCVHLADHNQQLMDIRRLKTKSRHLDLNKQILTILGFVRVKKLLHHTTKQKHNMPETY